MTEVVSTLIATRSYHLTVMSLTRVVLVAFQAFCNQLACTPPNPTPPKFRYHNSEIYILQIAPLIFKAMNAFPSWHYCCLMPCECTQIHQLTLWFCATFEVLHYIAETLLLASEAPIAAILACPASQPNVRITPIFLVGVIAVALGTYIRLDCFHTLGKLFTFDLTLLPEHKLVTSRLYSYVRHPAYTGSLLLVSGLAFSHLTSGSWMTECGLLQIPGSSAVIWAVWWLWTFSVGVSRAEAEDRQMQKTFKDEWEAYAANVHWWFFPGLI